MAHEESVPDLTRIVERPARVGQADVRRLEDATRALRARDYRHGGGVCRQTVLGRLAWGRALLGARTSDPVRARLLTAVADLHNLAGWTSFDTGRTVRALAHYRAALELVGEGGNHAMEANLRYRIGRLHLHRRAPSMALTEFNGSRAAAVRAGSAHAAAIASVNLAWAHAMRAQPGDAVRQLDRGRDELAAADDPVPPWETFFGATDLAAMIGTVHTELAARGDRHHARQAVPALTAAVRDYGEGMRRSQVFCLTMLALDHVLDGDLDAGANVAIEATDRAAELTSARVLDRMRPLLARARRDRRHPGMAEVAERIRRLADAEVA